MRKKSNSSNNTKYKTIKIDSETHKLLKIYAAKNGLLIGDAVRVLHDKDVKPEK